MSNAWICLIAAGLLEIGWPLGLKMAQMPGRGLVGVIIAVSFMAVSGYLLFLAQQKIPIGTAYAVWTGIGAAGTFVVGLILFGDAASIARILGVTLIVSGVVVMKLGSSENPPPAQATPTPTTDQTPSQGA
jgi:quaternary ammonium compound-resistance protein SugE